MKITEYLDEVIYYVVGGCQAPKYVLRLQNCSLRLGEHALDFANCIIASFDNLPDSVFGVVFELRVKAGGIMSEVCLSNSQSYRYLPT